MPFLSLDFKYWIKWNKPHVLVCCLAVLSPFLSVAQQQRALDSVSQLLSQSRSDTQKVRLMSAYAFRLQELNSDSALKISEKAVSMAEKLNQPFLLAMSYTTLATIWDEKSNTDKAILFYEKALKIFQSLKSKGNIAKIYYNEGLTYHTSGDYSKSMDCLTKAMRTYEETGDKAMISEAMSAMAKVYREIGQMKDALNYQEKAQKLAEELGDKQWLAKEDISLGLLYTDLKQFPDAILMFEKARAIIESGDNAKNKAILYTDIGNVYFIMEDFPKAIEYYTKSLDLAKSVGNRYGIALLQLNIGSVYQRQKNYSKSEEFYKLSEKTTLEINNKDMLMDIYSNESELYKAQKQYDKALHYHELYSAVRDSLLSDRSIKQVEELTKKYETDKKEKQILSLTRDNALKQLEFLKQEHDLERQRVISLASLAGILILLGFAWLVFNRYKIKKRANDQLQEQNEAISRQKTLIEEKNRSITDSINYASRIQTALLPAEQQFRSQFSDSFIYFQPKDIVSGDFYWIAEVGDKVIYATADCTGHGVPGGFMTMLGTSLLTEIVSEKGIAAPSRILDELRSKVILALKQHDENTKDAAGVTNSKVRDGMDISLCCVNKKTLELTYATAFHDICLIRDNQVIELSGDKQPIGYFGDMQKPFTEKTIQLKKGDWIYTFTDGYADQFGGEKGKKFKYRNLVETLVRNHNLSSTEQKEKYKMILDDWRGSLEQIDDICLIGVRI